MSEPDQLTPKEAPEDPTRTIEMITGAPGAVIGSYRLIRQLGEGGMGVVYHAQQLQPIRRDVALKIIKPGMDSKQVIARFESERQALAIMDHANIARVFDAGTTSTGRPYFAMELIDGVPITRYCDSKRLTLRERIELFIPVCQAIQHAHQKGIIHRDIKPSNVLIAEQEGKPTPKVIDFGLAKALGHQLSDATMMTNYDTVVGTFQYMSPEQAELGRHDIDTRSDVYSLGAVLYELLAGTTPLEHGSLAKASYVEILQRVREEEPAPPSARTHRSVNSAESAARRRTDPAHLPKLLDGELDWITMKALEKDRTRRYETVNALAGDLKRYLEGEPVEAAPPSTAYRLGKFVRKHRAWLATAAAFTLLLAAAVVVSSLMAVRARRAEQEAQAVNSFLQNDLLAQASSINQAGPGNKPDPDMKVRDALNRAAAGIGGEFGMQPLVEASIRQTIGDTYKDLGLYPEAQQQIERALASRRRLLGENNRDTLTSMSHLARLYMKQGKYAQAEPLLNELVDLSRRILGAEHPETLDSMGSLGSLYFYQGKFPKAEALDKQVLDLRRRVLGEENRDTMTTMNNLAQAYETQGNYEQAEPLATRVLDLQRRVLGRDHPYTLISMNNLTSIYRDQKKYTQAEAMLTDVAESQRRVLGEDHPDRLTALFNLAGTYEDEEKYAQAEQLLKKVLEAQRRVLGDEHPNTLETMSSLGRDLLRQQEYIEAEAMLRQSLKGDTNTRPESWSRYWGQRFLGETLSAEKKYAEAEQFLVPSFEGLLQTESSIPGRRTFVLATGEKIVTLYENWGKREKAAEWREKLQATSLANTSKRR